MMLLLLLLTCISLARSPMEGRKLQENHVPKANIPGKNIRVEQDIELGHPVVPRKILQSSELPQWDSLSDSIVELVEPALGRQRNVILHSFPLTKDRASAMENVGLLYVLQALEAKIYHSNGSKPKKVLAKVEDPKKGTFVIVAANQTSFPALKEYLESEDVQGVLIFLPSILGKHKTIYEDKIFMGLSRGNTKLKLFCHDKPTLDALHGQGWKDITSIPALTFCIPRVYRFLKPLFHYVFQSSVKEDGCKHIQGQPSVRCDSRSWSVEKWTTPKGINEVENVYLRTYIGYLYLLRGQVVIVDELAALFAAMQFDIPAVAFVLNSPDMKAYIDTWNSHGYQHNMRTAATLKEAAKIAMGMTKQLHDELVDFEPGVKIIKNFPK